MGPRSASADPRRWRGRAGSTQATVSRPETPRRRSFGPPPRSEPTPRLPAAVFSRASLAGCVPIALVIGTLLSLANRPSVIFSGDATAVTWIRVLADYLVRSA